MTAGQSRPATPKLPIVLSVLPTREEIESMAEWGTTQPGNDPGETAAALPSQDIDAEISRAIADYRARRATGKAPKTYTLDEVRKMLHLPSSPPR